MKEVMPNGDMQGEVQYYVNFKDKVKVRMTVSYSYQIDDPILFMKAAKRLGNTNSENEDASNDPERFESAENRVIDVNIKGVTSDRLVNEDVVTHNLNTLEEQYVIVINEILKTKGVRLTVYEMYTEFDVQTKQAIDVANADMIYESKGMKEFGRQVMLAKAGANQITISQESPKDSPKPNE